MYGKTLYCHYCKKKLQNVWVQKIQVLFKTSPESGASLAVFSSVDVIAPFSMILLL